MNQTDVSIGGFKQLWKEQYGQELTDEQAEAYEERLVAVVKLLIDIEIQQRERAPP